MKKLLVGLFILFTITCLSVLVNAASLEWDANTETDLAGYKVYQSSVPGEYTEPLEVLGKVTTYTLPDTISECLYYTVTAYDLEELESDKSNEVSNCDGFKPSTPGTLMYINNANITINVN